MLLAMVFGFCGWNVSAPDSIARATGLQPAACAAWMRGPSSDTRPRSISSRYAFQTLGRIVPPATGTTVCFGSRQPSCSAISKPWVLAPSV